MIIEGLKKMKEKSGMTAKQISERSGIPESTISRILSGQTDNPSFDTICSIVRAMDGSVDELIGMRNAAPGDEHKKDMHMIYESVIADKNKLIKILFIACGVIIFVILFLLIFDFVNGNIGFIRYGNG